MLQFKNIPTILLIFLLANCKQSYQENKQLKEIELGDYVFDFDNGFQQIPDSPNSQAGYIVGKKIEISYADGWINRGLTKVIEDTSQNSVMIDTVGVLFRRIIYSKDSIQGSIGIILTTLNNMKEDTNKYFFPNTFIGLEMHATGITKKQQDELLKIFLTGRLKKKFDET